MHHSLKFYETDTYSLECFVHFDHDITDEMSAKFKYLLFNFHTNQFQIKSSQESRLFNFKSITNLDETLDEFSMIHESCTKVPQVYFVLFPKTDEAKKTTKDLINNFKKL